MNGIFKKFIPALVAAIPLFLWNCEENPLPVALEDRNSQIVIDTLYARLDTTYTIDKIISTLESDRLLVGATAGFTFRSVLRFSFLAVPDSAVLDSVWMRFVALGANGENPVDFTATGYRVTNLWLSDTSEIWQDYSANVDFANPVGNMLLTPASDDTIIFQFTDFGKQLVQGWIDTNYVVPTLMDTVSNYGMAIDFTSANFVKELKARNSFEQTGVHLFIRYTAGSDTVMRTDSLLAITDAFLFQGEFPPIPERNQVSSLYPWSTLLDFDLDSLKRKYPNGLVVTSANMQLPVDWANTLTHGGSGPELQILPLINGLSDKDSLEIDSSFIGIITRVIDINRYTADSSFVEVTEGNDRRELASTYIQRKLNFPDVYQGFYVDHKAQNSYLARFSFFKHNFNDPGRRPRLIIYSLRFPDERL